jgi:hypothetical protein
MEIYDPDSDHALVPKEKMRRALSMKETINNPTPKPDRDDIEMLFRCGMQFMRYLAKKYGFTIKQWPEK